MGSSAFSLYHGMARLCCVLALLLPLASSADDGFTTSDDNVDTVQIGMDGAGHHDHPHLAARAEYHAHHSHGASNDSQAQLNHSTRARAMLHSRHEQLDRSLSEKKKEEKDSSASDSST